MMHAIESNPVLLRHRGLGSKLQVFANKAATVLMKKPPGRVFVPTAGFGLYTAGCDASEQWRCYFEPLAPAACGLVEPVESLKNMGGVRGLAAIKKAVEASMGVAAVRATDLETAVCLPGGIGILAGRGDDLLRLTNRWYGAVQGYLWRPNRRFQGLVAAFLAQLEVPVSRIDIALHIRLGDKQGDAQSACPPFPTPCLQCSVS